MQYSKHCSKNIRDRSKIEITQTWRYNYIDKNMRVRESQDIHVRGTASRFKEIEADYVCDNGVVEVRLLHV